MQGPGNQQGKDVVDKRKGEYQWENGNREQHFPLSTGLELSASSIAVIFSRVEIETFGRCVEAIAMMEASVVITLRVMHHAERDDYTNFSALQKPHF